METFTPQVQKSLLGINVYFYILGPGISYPLKLFNVIIKNSNDFFMGLNL